MANEQISSLNDCPAFLLSQIGAEIARRFADELRPLGVSPRAFGVMARLRVDVKQNQQQLASTMGIHRNNMVALIDEMELAGWVRRHRDEADRRAFTIELTSQGAAMVKRVRTRILALDERVVASLPDAKRAQLLSMLQDISVSLGLDPGVHPTYRTAR